MKLRNIVVEVVAALYLCLYLYTAISKLTNFDLSLAQMNKQPFPDYYTPVLVWLIPILELICAGLLISDRTKLIGLYFSGGLMLVFTVYVSLVMVNFYGHIPCSCGGLISTLSWGQHLLLNIAYLLLAIMAIWLLRYKIRNSLSVKI